MADENTPLLRIEGGNIGFKPLINKSKSLVSLKQLFRFCDSTDRYLLVLGVFGSIAYGFIIPGQFMVLGSVIEDFIDYGRSIRNNRTTTVDLEARTTKVAMWYIVFAFANILFSWMGMGLFALSAERQAHKIKLALFRSAIYQNIAWFDQYSTGEINTRLTEDVNVIVEGIGLKFGRLISCVVSFFSGYAIGFALVWKLALVLVAVFPLMVLVGAAMAKVTGDQTANVLQAYSKAGFVAEQSIAAIRTVAAFGGEENQASLYHEHLGDACKFGVKKGLATGLGMGAFQIVIYANFCVSMWYLVKLTKNKEALPGDGMTTFFASLLGALMLGQAGPSGEAIAVAMGAADTVFKIIDRQSEIDASSDTGLKPAVIQGDVELSHIDFVYPTRKSVPILNDFSLKVASGTRVAFVGESGCGKSTVVKLIQRFYDPTSGSVLLDGQNIKSLNVRHLRNFIGVVNQEPVLFATTISENISYGREGVSQQEIEEAAKMANAHDFITKFPKGYETLCGERGAQMSGGQKQRIAIARALVRNPKILLLDEATSALDTESETIVQEALDKAGKGRTTIIIAHRLSTIKNADVIVTFNEGTVEEMGTHEELMAKDGLYSSLVKLQERDDEDSHENDRDVEQILGEKLAVSSIRTTVSSRTSNFAGNIEEDDDDYDPKFKLSFGNILKLNAPEWHYLLLGCLGAALYGTYPFLFGITFGGISDALSNNPNIPKERKDMEDDGLKWSIFFLILGIESGVGIFLQNYYFSKAGEALTMRLRKQAFLAFLRQNIGYFDKPSHGTGAICSRLASEVSSIQGATGSQLGFLCSALVTVAGGFLVSLQASWKLGLVMIAFVPLLVVAGKFLNTYLGGGEKSSKAAGNMSDAALMADETLSNIQTVVSLGREEEFFEKYRTALTKSFRKAKKIGHLSGLTNGMLTGIINLSFAAGFRYGGYLAVEREITIDEMMRSIFTVIICAITVGQVASMTPDYSKAKRAANRIFYLFQKVPVIDSYSEAGSSPETCNGEIDISNVRFSYPTRRNCKVLRNLSFTIKPGQTVALVGSSGCGKTTSISLVERFYDVISGKVTIDGRNVKDLNLRWLRSQIGIVSQEPVLFDLSIRDNIAYGDTTRTVSDKEIEHAARSANIHEFIIALPQGYKTMVGDKGTLISGGQKQRIAIARALIRDPKILLLDEATSALDTESEKVVQQALDKASIGRTTLVIAHRLSTIQHADQIFVIKKGRVVERGNHNKLIALKGIYYTLHKAQSLSHK